MDKNKWEVIKNREGDFAIMEKRGGTINNHVICYFPTSVRSEGYARMICDAINKLKNNKSETVIS